MKSVLVRTLFAAVTAAFLTAPALAAEPVVWKAVSNTRNSSQFTEKWKFFADEMKKRTNGEVVVEVTSFPELNLTGSELIRMLKTNLVDIAEVVVGYVSGDAPILEGVYLAGMYENYDQVHQGYDAFQPLAQDRFAGIIGGRTIGSFAFSAQHIWSKFPINSLDDIKGKKIRVFAASQADYINALGGEAVFIPLGDLYVSLERGLADGAVTGPESGAGQKLWEVTKYITDLRLGAGSGFVVVSNKSYNALSDKNKAVFDELAKEIDAMGWSIGVKDTKAGIDLALKNGMELVEPAKPEWRDKLIDVTSTVVIPRWIERSKGDSAKMFTETMAPVIGFDAKK